jgi:sigma-B regulation protein RsbU (phosphoserine phosphatase)
MNDSERLLARVPLFSELPESELGRLAESLQIFQFSPGEVLFLEGERGDSFYIVRRGQLEVLKNLGAQDERRLATRGPGEFVGEMSLLRPDGLRTASVRAVDRVETWCMSRHEFDSMLHRQPMLAYQMVRVLGDRLNIAHNTAIAELIEKNRQLRQAYDELRAAQQQIIEKERLERELEVARQIQMGILPDILPEMDGFDFGARISPARSVGGDFFDFVSLNDGLLAIMVGDVTDKGVPAAIFMAQVHALLRAEAGRALSPGVVLANVNQHLLEMNAHGLFVTVLYGVLERDHGRFSYARAGHELPLLRLPDGQVSLAAMGIGQPVGIIDDMLVDEASIDIPPGGMLILYTDGITDERSPLGEHYGIARFQELVRSLPEEYAQTACDQIMETVLGFLQGAHQDDDVTVVAIRNAG